MKKNTYSLISTILYLAAITLNIFSLLSFGVWDNSALGSTLLCFASSCLCFGIFLSRKGDDNNRLNESMVNKEIAGKVIAVKKQWWIKINTKAFRTHTTDGAIFPHIITVEYVIDGVRYTKRKWIKAHRTPPIIGSSVTVLYSEQEPKNAKIL